MNTNSIVSFFLKRKWIFATLLIITPAGFLCKWYSGPAHRWFNDYGGAVMYGIFWCMVIFLFRPQKQAATKIAAAVFVITSFLELLQLWRLPILQQARSTLLGRALLGTTFVWWDFLYYLLGCLIAWLLMRVISSPPAKASQPALSSKNRRR